MDDQLRKKIKNLQLKTKHHINNAIKGNYLSAFKGQGLEFEESRAYSFGDDVRHIDWKLTAKAREPYLKVYQDERELIFFIVLDLSKSLNFGSDLKSKQEIANEISAIISYLALSNNDKIGLIMFTDKIEFCLLPKKGKSQVYKILKELMDRNPSSIKTNLSMALEHLNKIHKRKAIIFIVSDFLDKQMEKNLSLTGRKHDVICVHIEDKFEKKISYSGFLRISDLESGISKIVKVNSKTPEGSKNTVDTGKSLKTICHRNKIDYISINTQDDYMGHFIKFLKYRTMLHK